MAFPFSKWCPAHWVARCHLLSSPAGSAGSVTVCHTENPAAACSGRVCSVNQCHPEVFASDDRCVFSPLFNVMCQCIMRQHPPALSGMLHHMGNLSSALSFFVYLCAQKDPQQVSGLSGLSCCNPFRLFNILVCACRLLLTERALWSDTVLVHQ